MIAVSGSVTAIGADRETRRTLAADDVVHPGEMLATGEAGRVQVRFNDDGLVALQPETRFEIERYTEASDDAGGSALMHLIEGALRTITGAISKGEEDHYELTTPVATLGVRGTEYSLDFCASNCAGVERRPGLYGRVADGEITVSTERGSGAFDAGEYFYVAGQATLPERISTPPQGLRFSMGAAGAAEAAGRKAGRPKGLPATEMPDPPGLGNADAPGRANPPSGTGPRLGGNGAGAANGAGSPPGQSGPASLPGHGKGRPGR